jgi:membrane-bound serine protease (ClpP class)
MNRWFQRETSRAARAGLWAAVCLAWLAAGPAAAQPARPVVYVVPIDGIIDLGLAPFVSRVLKDAAGARADAVVLEVNTLGGRVDAAILIRDALLETPLRTIAFINKRAISAGALISLGARTIAMADGATIGAATPVEIGAGGGAQAVGEKTVSYMRKEFRATAESRGRPPLIAEAMVDADVVIADVIEKGKLLTLTTSEALTHRVADFRADTLAKVLDHLQLGHAEIRRPSINWAEQVVRALTHPIFSSVLMTVGLLGIIVELRTPGFGLPGALGITSLALFFGGHWLVRLAGWEEILLVATGLLLLGLELFVIPGFGITGVLGILAIAAGLGLSLVGAGPTWAAVMAAVGRVALSVLLALASVVFLLRFLPRLPFGRALVLATVLDPLTADAPAVPGDRRWLHLRGVALSPLHPAGIADLGGERVDVVSGGEYIAAGDPIEVVRVEGNRIVVRRVRGEPKE